MSRQPRPTRSTRPPKKASQKARTSKKVRLRPPPAYDPNADIVRGFQLKAATGLSTVTVWRLRNAGKFPPPIRLGEHAVGWRRADITAWLASRVASQPGTGEIAPKQRAL